MRQSLVPVAFYLRRVWRAYLFVPVLSSDLRMRNFSVFSFVYIVFRSSIILLEYNAFYIPLVAAERK